MRGWSAGCVAVFLLLRAPLGFAAIPIQPVIGDREGCSPPGVGACAVAPGLWLGTAGNDSVQVWVSPDGAAVDSVIIVTNGNNCTVPSRFLFQPQWKPAKKLEGLTLPDCMLREARPCVPPHEIGFDLMIVFRSTSCGLVELLLRDPLGRTACPAPCPALDDLHVTVESRPWGVLKLLYR